MPDEMDAVQERVLAATEAAIAAARPKTADGCGECECGEPISLIRQQMGAVRCIDCQVVFERSAAIASGRRS